MYPIVYNVTSDVFTVGLLHKHITDIDQANMPLSDALKFGYIW